MVAMANIDVSSGYGNQGHAAVLEIAWKICAHLNSVSAGNQLLI